MQGSVPIQNKTILSDYGYVTISVKVIRYLIWYRIKQAVHWVAVA